MKNPTWQQIAFAAASVASLVIAEMYVTAMILALAFVVLGLSMSRQTLNAEHAIAQMYPVSVKPEPRSPGEARSELLVVGHYTPDGDLVLYKTLVKYRIHDDAWLEDKTDKVVNMEVTHWIKASEQDKLFS